LDYKSITRGRAKVLKSLAQRPRGVKTSITGRLHQEGQKLKEIPSGAKAVRMLRWKICRALLIVDFLIVDLSICNQKSSKIINQQFLITDH
jgi:hypothetical protein